MNFHIFAKYFALGAHGAVGQRRDWTDEIYFAHVDRVADNFTDDVTKAIAYLHDVLEDTEVTADYLREYFSEEICDGVEMLTSPPKEFGTRAQRKAEDIRRLKDAKANLQSIKVADMIDNMPSIIKNDKEFAKKYVSEKTELLAVLGKAEPALIAKATKIIEDYYDSVAPL